MSSRHPRTDSRARRPIVRIVASLLLLGALAAAAAGVWYLFLRPAAPATVGFGAVPSASPASTSDATAEPTAEATIGSPTIGTADSLEGTWAVDGSIGSFDDFSGSFVGYRVREELAGIGAAEAVGRTPDVSGALTFEGTSVTSAEFTADLTTLRSDSSMRDGQLGRQGLETDTFPTATFVLTQPIDLGTMPADGETFSATAVGDLALHGVTRSVEIALEGRLTDGVVTVVGTLPILFGDYDIPTPESMRVLSIDENGTMEFQLHFTRT